MEKEPVQKACFWNCIYSRNPAAQYSAAVYSSFTFLLTYG